jgi:hypothetical protein
MVNPFHDPDHPGFTSSFVHLEFHGKDASSNIDTFPLPLYRHFPSAVFHSSILMNLVQSRIFRHCRDTPGALGCFYCSGPIIFWFGSVSRWSGTFSLFRGWIQGFSFSSLADLWTKIPLRSFDTSACLHPRVWVETCVV